MSKLEVGSKAPEFALLDQNGKTHDLKDYFGQWVLIYFYPKDDTPGCTIEACNFRDNMPDFDKLNIKVLGISHDKIDSHQDFIKKYSLNFILLSDPEKEVIKKYGANAGFMTRRISYLIDKQGLVYKIYSNVDVEKHALEVLEDIKNSNNN